MKNVTTILTAFAIAIGLSSFGQALEATTQPVKISVGKKPTPTVERSVTEEKKETINLQTLGITSLPKYYALIIGISDYQYTNAQLPNLGKPVEDAQKLRDVLVQNYAFDDQNVLLLKNPTREQIINHLDRLIQEVGEKDNLLVFYAGHGYYDKASDFGFWLPSDAKTSSRASWIANSTIKDYIGAIKSKHTLLITDACFGGSIFKTRSVGNILMKFNEVYKEDSRKAITSGNLTEVPDQSIFLKYLLKSLDENQDVFLSSSMLFSRIYEPILYNSPSTPQFGVVQGAGDEGGDFVFIKKN